MRRLFIPLLLLLAGCDGTFINYDVPFEGERLVINGLIAANAPVQVSVGRTWRLEGTIPNYFVENATVELFENDSLVAQLKHTSKGVYTTPFKAKSRFEYSCKVTAPNFQVTTTVKTKVPPAFPYVSYNLDKNGYFSLNSGRNEPANMSLIIRPGVSQDNFYSIKIRPTFQNNALSGGTEMLDFNMNQESNCIFIRRVEVGSAFYFAGRCLNEKSKFLFGIETIGTDMVDSTAFKSKKATRIVVSMRNVSKEYFDFMKNYNEPQDIERAFVEPAPTFTNVIGGYGLWASFNETQIEIPL